VAREQDPNEKDETGFMFSRISDRSSGPV